MSKSPLADLSCMSSLTAATDHSERQGLFSIHGPGAQRVSHIILDANVLMRWDAGDVDGREGGKYSNNILGDVHAALR